MPKCMRCERNAISTDVISFKKSFLDRTLQVVLII